ncbi:tetratricopeptide repeat protein [Prochlorococcus marinus]|uniref:tetratricopeptide repeat protein n=1 Tax=Prochlorococcus marinus TaxID=1219 RepID=UPI0022B502DF|nr:tetratricopeptide repeat protein [Prochlorococcus marinus]
MDNPNKQDKESKVNEVKTFPVPFALSNNKKNFVIPANTASQPSKEQIINQALTLHTQGDIAEAAKYYQHFINQGFKDYRVFTNYGVILTSLGKLQEAELSLRKAIELNPDFATAHSNLGNILKDLGKLQEAELSLRKAIVLNPDFAMAHSNLGNILKDLGKLQEAELSLRKAIVLNPDFADAHYNLGIILSDLGKLQEAELSTRKAIELNPDFAEAHSNLGNILDDLGKLQEAELSLRKAIELNPDFAEAHSNLGNILDDLGKLQEAELSLRKAIELNPDLAEAYYNLGNTLRNLGKLQEAELSLRKAIELNPDYYDAYFNLSWLQLLRGEYQSGLNNYEFRFKTKQPIIPPTNSKLEQLKSNKLQKNGSLLIVREGGLGDTLQYMRYIPYLRSQGLDVSFCAQEELHTLIKSSGIETNPLTPEQTIKVSEGTWIPLLSLPRYLQVRPDNPIINDPYIFPSVEFVKKWENILSNERRPIIGINWQGNPNAEKQALKGRSLPLETFSTIARNNNFNFLSLQKAFGSEQLDHCSFKNKFVECQPQINNTWDFLEIAGIIENCDLIITSDTSIAHLAGGMGKSTWLLLHYVPGWIWGLQGENTFWYPSMRLFRQKERNNWQEVLERVNFELESIFNK